MFLFLPLYLTISLYLSISRFLYLSLKKSTETYSRLRIKKSNNKAGADTVEQVVNSGLAQILPGRLLCSLLRQHVNPSAQTSLSVVLRMGTGRLRKAPALGVAAFLQGEELCPPPAPG